MEFVWLGTAFVFGVIAKRLGQQPILGFLAAGFVLAFAGYEGAEAIESVAELGVQLLLFTIGLKLDLRTLIRPHVWGTSLAHMLLFGAAASCVLMVLMAAGVRPFDALSVETAAKLAFGLSFSSTIFAVKLLEDRNDSDSFYGRASIAILVVQDVAAVVFIVATSETLPSPWAAGAVLLIPLRPFLRRLLVHCGHGELLVLAGLCATFGFAALAKLVGLKPDLGALIAGLLLGGHHPKANELAKSLFAFKDVFLVGFFVSVGLYGLPSASTFGAAVIFTLLLPLKALLFVGLGLSFRLRVRTSLLLSASLTQISEFGLIVLLVMVTQGTLDPSWLIAMALALSLSFLASAAINKRVYAFAARYSTRLVRWQSTERLEEEKSVDLSDADYLVFGMGRIGTAAYQTLTAAGHRVVGIDVDATTVSHHIKAGRWVVEGSGTDAELWERMHFQTIEWALFTMASHSDHMTTLRQLKESHGETKVAVIAHYPDQIEELKEAGADIAVHLLAEAGTGFAAHVLADSDPQPGG